MSTCTNTIPARPGYPAHLCGKEAKYYCRTVYGELLELCEECRWRVDGTIAKMRGDE